MSRVSDIRPLISNTRDPDGSSPMKCGFAQADGQTESQTTHHLMMMIKNSQMDKTSISSYEEAVEKLDKAI